MLSFSKSVIWTSRCRTCGRDTAINVSNPHPWAFRFSTSRSSFAAQEPSFPYPSRRNPTPHEIFHLPRNATEADIKARYFDLVRLYHPDRVSDVSADAAHARFQAITRAYDILRGKLESGSSGPADPLNPNPSVDLRYQTTAAWRAAHRRRQQDLYSSGAADDKWKDRIILLGVVSTVVFVIAHTFTVRKEVMVETVNRTRQMSSSPPREEQQQRRAINDLRLSAEPESSAIPER